MPVIEWSENLEIGLAPMDDTHQEFIECLNALADAPDAQLLPALEHFTAHCESHFAQEDAWMTENDFPPAGCHTGEHAQILDILAQVKQRLVEEQDVEIVRRLAEELPAWFDNHANTMDFALAFYLQSIGKFPPSEIYQEALRKAQQNAQKRDLAENEAQETAAIAAEKDRLAAVEGKGCGSGCSH